MREIDNNIKNSVNNIKGIQKPAVEESVNESSSVSFQGEAKEIKDLSGPAASIGKSQISSDSIEKDMQFFAKNPDEVKKMNAVFEGKFLENHTYEEATQLMEAYKNEFVNKK